MRREEGWFVCDTGSHLGTRVRGREITEPALIEIGDKFSMGGTTLILRNADDTPKKKRNIFTGFSKEAASPFRLMPVSYTHLARRSSARTPRCAPARSSAATR